MITKLAKEFKGEKDIIIAKIDGTANDAPPEYAVTDFPTMYYAIPGKKLDPIPLESEKRDMEGFKKFIEEKSVILKKKKEAKEAKEARCQSILR